MAVKNCKGKKVVDAHEKSDYDDLIRDIEKLHRDMRKLRTAADAIVHNIIEIRRSKSSYERCYLNIAGMVLCMFDCNGIKHALYDVKKAKAERTRVQNAGKTQK